VRQRIAAMQLQLQSAGHAFRDPPAEPSTCCGRGCNGCVWESYDAALLWWLEQAQALSTEPGPEQGQALDPPAPQRA